jgi:hypothetical protein
MRMRRSGNAHSCPRSEALAGADEVSAVPCSELMCFLKNPVHVRLHCYGFAVNILICAL